MNRTARLLWPRSTPLAVLALALVGCAAYLTADPPGPGVPRISGLEIIPDRTTVGCPATVRFDFEDLHGDVTRVVAHWTLEQANRHIDSGYATVAVEPGTFAATRGVVTAR